MRYILITLSFLIISCSRIENVSSFKSLRINSEAVDKINEGDYESALILLNNAIELDSLSFSAYRNKIITFMRMERINDAILTNKIWIAQNPNSADRYFLLGSIYISIGDSINAKPFFNKAILFFQEKLSRNEMVFDTEIYLALCYKFVGEEEKSLNLFNKYLPQEKEKYIKLMESLFEPRK